MWNLINISTIPHRKNSLHKVKRTPRSLNQPPKKKLPIEKLEISTQIPSSKG